MAQARTVQLVPALTATLYDGSNADEIMSLFPEVTGMLQGKFRPKKGKEDSKAITIHYDDAGAGPADFEVNVGDYVIHGLNGGVPATITGTEVATGYVTLDSVKNLK